MHALLPKSVPLKPARDESISYSVKAEIKNII